MGFILTSISYDQISDFLIKVLAPVTAAAILGLFAILRKHLRKNYSEEQLIELLRKKYRERVKNHPSIKLMDKDKDLLPSGNPTIELLFTDPYTGNDVGFKRIIEQSWADSNHRHIELVGAGGMGKTVTMLSMNRIAAQKPAIFVQLNELNDAAGIVDPIKDYIVNRVLNRNEKYYNSLLELCGLEWDNGPRVLLVLDGLNEISDSTKKRNILCNIEEWARMSGIQIICSSRDNLPGQLTNMPPFLKIDILPLPEDRIISYLIKSDILPPNRASLSLLSNPLLLNLYTKTGALQKTIQETNLVLFKDSNTKGGIIWNYLQSELYRISNITRNNAYDAALCIIVSEFITPCMAYAMLGRGDHSSTEKWFRNDIIKAIDLLNQSILPERIEDNYNILRDHFGEDCISVDNVKEALTVKMHLISFDGFVYKFMHQQFRDALAAIHLINISYLSQDDQLPNEWKDFIDSSVMDFVFDLASPDFFNRLWEQNRRCPSGDRATLVQLEIQGKLKDNDFSSLDFSGMDLSNIFLYPYASEHFISLPTLAHMISGTKISIKTIDSPGDATFYFGCPIFVHNNKIALSSNEQSILVWDVQTRQLKRDLYCSYCDHMFVTPDERKLFTVSSQFARIWSIDGPINSWRHLRTIRGNGFTLIHGGKMLVFGGEDMNLHVWSIIGKEEDWKELRVLYLPPTEETDQFFYKLAVTPNEQILACSFNQKVSIWNIAGDVEDWAIVKQFDEPVNSTFSLKVTPDNRMLWISFGNNELWVWSIEGDIENWKRLTTFYHYDSYEFMPDGKTVLMGSRGSIQQMRIEGPVGDWSSTVLYNVDSKADNSVKNISISPNGNYMVSNTWCTTSIWKRNKGKWEYLRNLTSSLRHDPTQYSFSNDSRLVVVGQHGTNTVWGVGDRAGDPTILKTIQSFRPHVSSMAFSFNRHIMVCGFGDGTLCVWEINDEGKAWRLLKVLGKHEGEIRALSISKDVRKVVSGSMDGEIRIWSIDGDIEQWGIIRTLNPHDHLLLDCNSLSNETLIDTSKVEESFYSIVQSDDSGSFICVGSHSFCLGDIQGPPSTWILNQDFDRPVQYASLAITTDGKYLICGSCCGGIVHIMSRGEGQGNWYEVRTIEGEKYNETWVALSEDNRRMAILSYHHIGIWDIQGPPEKWYCLKEENLPGCTSFALSRDGSKVALFSHYDARTLLWDINGEEGPKRIDSLNIRITAGAFTPDCNKLIAAGDDMIHLLDLESNQITHIKITPMSFCGLDLTHADIDSEVRQILAWNGAVV